MVRINSARLHGLGLALMPVIFVVGCGPEPTEQQPVSSSGSGGGGKPPYLRPEGVRQGLATSLSTFPRVCHPMCRSL